MRGTVTNGWLSGITKRIRSLAERGKVPAVRGGCRATPSHRGTRSGASHERPASLRIHSGEWVSGIRIHSGEWVSGIREWVSEIISRGWIFAFSHLGSHKVNQVIVKVKVRKFVWRLGYWRPLDDDWNHLGRSQFIASFSFEGVADLFHYPF
jgi:hypothetical protein